MKYALAILTALGIALSIGAAATLIPVPDRAPLFTAAPPPPEAEVIASRDITNVAFDGKGTVSYEYLADHVPARISPDEVPELRTARSYTKLKGVKETKDGSEYTLESIFYAQKTFEDVNGSWRYIEYGTTTEDVWKKRPVSYIQKFKEFFVATAHAVDLFSAVGDGQLYSYSTGVNSGSVWTGARNASSGTADHVSNAFYVATDRYTTDCEFGCIYEAVVYRSFIPFDTSAIPASASVSSASLNLFVTSVTDSNNNGSDYVTISTSTQATHTSLTSTDFNDAGPLTMNDASEVIDSGQRKDLTSITTNAYLAFTFNANGIAAIKKGGQSSTCSATAGITCLSAREGHDTTGTVPTLDTGGNYVSFSSSEATGTSQDPYLSVTYSIPVGITIGGSGTLRVGAGGNLRF